MANGVTGRNGAAAGMAGVAGYASLHSADPGTTGASELSGGSPAYARKAITWAAPSGGNDVTNAAVTFDVPAGADVAYGGLWTAPTGGSWVGGGALTASEHFTGQGEYRLNSATIAAT